VKALLYHDVVEPGEQHASGFSGRDADLYKLERAQFRTHLEALARNGGGRVALFEHVLEQRRRHTRRAPVVLTFDDGGHSAHGVIAGELERLGWRGHFFVTTDYVGDRRFLSAAQLRDLHARGHVIGTHSCSHPPRMSACSWSELLDEWSRSARELESMIGAPVHTGSIPGGYYSRRVAEAAAASRRRGSGRSAGVW
jgi:peptidoglycan/xylan/chitin deacetylase (PgdA/CDA1 family)